MNDQYRIIYDGVPAPENRGRKKGSHDARYEARQAAIAKGVAFVKSGLPYDVAAEKVKSEQIWWNVTEEHIARLIRNQSKEDI